MKRIQAVSLLFIALFFSIFALGQNTKSIKDYLSIPGPLVIDNHSYNLSWSSHPNANYYKQEYLQAGDNPDRFKTMILMDVITGQAKTKDLVSAKLTELKKLKESNPIVNYEIFSNTKTGEYIIDFLLSDSPTDGKKISIVERNVYRYRSFTGNNGQKGTLLFGVSTRSYNNDIDQFLLTLKTTRAQLNKTVSQFIIPVITLLK